MSGTYTIGKNGTEDFTSFNDAVYNLENRGISGAVVFNVSSGTYTEQFILNEISGVNSTNTITFKSSTGDSTDVTLKYASTHEDTNYVVMLNGADFITFQNMTIEATVQPMLLPLKLKRCKSECFQKQYFKSSLSCKWCCYRN
jgi:hypothetical protein